MTTITITEPKVGRRMAAYLWEEIKPRLLTNDNKAYLIWDCPKCKGVNKNLYEEGKPFFLKCKKVRCETVLKFTAYYSY